MKKVLFEGCGTALATPFNDKGVNIKEFKKLLEFQLKNNVDALIVCGTTGESSTMTQEEKKLTIKCAIKTSNNKVPVIVGTGSNNTIEAIINSKIAQDLGADAVLIVTPYYNKCTQYGLLKHYSLIAEKISIPIILYNVPSRTGVNIEPSTCFELSKISNIVAIKEASGNISQVAQIARLCGDNLHIYSGNDDQILPVLSLGGKGVISVLSNIEPKYVHNIVKLFLSGNMDKSKKLQLNALPLINALFSEVNPIGIKCALNLSGFDFGKPRLPLNTLSDENLLLLQNELKKFVTI